MRNEDVVQLEEMLDACQDELAAVTRSREAIWQMLLKAQAQRDALVDAMRQVREHLAGGSQKNVLHFLDGVLQVKT